MSSHPSTTSPHVNSSSTSPPSKRIANPYIKRSNKENIKTAFALLVGENQATTAFMPLPLQRNKVMENFLVLIYNLKSMIVDDTEHEYW